MQVYYKLVSGGSYSLLFDESAGDANEEFAPTFRDAVDKHPGYGAASAWRSAMSNTECTIAFRWNSSYSTAALAKDAHRSLRATFKGVPVHLKIISGTGTGSTSYFPNAVMESSGYKLRNISVDHHFTFSADDETTTAP